MGKEFLPQTNNNIMFSPLAVKDVFAKAVQDEGGNVDNIFNQRSKYKQLLEMWQASFLSVGIYKWTGKKFFLIPSDSPDVYFINKKEDGEQEGFPVEVMELYNHGQTTFDGNYENLAEKVWGTKGKKSYGNCELLLVARINSQEFNMIMFAEALNKYKWPYVRIWVSIYTRAVTGWTIFEIMPYERGLEIKYLSIHLNDQPF